MVDESGRRAGGRHPDPAAGEGGGPGLDRAAGPDRAAAPDRPDGAPLYPLGLRLSGRRVLVVGGGAVASRRVPALLDAGADVVVVSPSLTPVLRALADAERLSWIARRFEPSDVDGSWLVQVAVDDPQAATVVSEAADQRRVFCVRADNRHAASAWTPAVTRHGPVTVAVLGGGDPRRAMALRDAIRDGLSAGTLDGRGAGLPAGGPAPLVAGTSGPAAPEPAAPGPVVPEQVAPAAVTRSAAGAAAEASGAGRGTMAGPRSGWGEPDPVVGRVALVGAGPGDPELITVRGRRLLAEADVVVVDRLVPGLLLDELRPEVELVDASKIPYGPARSQDEINRILVARARAGATVVRLKGGDPYVFGRGGEEVLACAAAAVPVTVVPGVTSAVAVPAVAGIPVTHRGVAHEFTVVSGHVPPDDPASLVDWQALARMRGTLVILMGLRHLAAIVAALREHGRAASTPAAVVAEGTTAVQRVVRTTLAEVVARVAEHGIRPPAVVVLGDVVTALATTSVAAAPATPGGP